jgi:hypothetical protein
VDDEVEVPAPVDDDAVEDPADAGAAVESEPDPLVEPPLEPLSDDPAATEDPERESVR